MVHVRELSGTTNASDDECVITVPAGVTIPAGSILSVGVSTSSASLPTLTVEDTAQHTWLPDGAIQVAASGATTQLRTITTDDLVEDDTIVIKSTVALPRFAAAMQEFDDGVIGVDTGATGNNGGASSNTPTTGPFTTTVAETLIVATIGLISPGRIFTPAAGYTAGTKIASTNGSGDRAVQMMWQYVTDIDTYVANGTLNSSSLYGMVARVYKLGDPVTPTGSGKAKVRVSGNWEAHPFKTWNGTAWQTRVAKRHDGVSWVPIT